MKLTVRDFEHGMRAVKTLPEEVYLFYLRKECLVYEYDSEAGKRYTVFYDDEKTEGLTLELVEELLRAKMDKEQKKVV